MLVEPLGDVGAVGVVVHQLADVERLARCRTARRCARTAPASARAAPSAWMPTVSAAIRLPGALSSVTCSKSRSWASAGRYISRPSASHAVGCARVETRCRATLSASRSAGRSAPRGASPSAVAPCSASVAALYSSTLGWSISNTVVPAGHSQPVGARVQAGRQDDDLPDTRRGGRGEVRVEEVRAHGLVVAHVLEDRGDLGIDVGDLGDELARRACSPTHRCPRPRPAPWRTGRGSAGRPCRSRRRGRRPPSPRSRRRWWRCPRCRRGCAASSSGLLRLKLGRATARCRSTSSAQSSVRRSAQARHLVRARHGVDAPAVVGQPFGGVGPLGVGVHQGVDVDVQSRGAPASGRCARAGRSASLFGRVLRQVQAERLDRDPAARRAVRGDQVEEPVLGVAGADTAAGLRPARRSAAQDRSRRRVSAAGQSSRRSTATGRGAPAAAHRAHPASRSCSSSTLGWSISNTVVPAGQSSRYARESRPAARMTTWRMPARTAASK